MERVAEAGDGRGRRNLTQRGLRRERDPGTERDRDSQPGSHQDGGAGGRRTVLLALRKAVRFGMRINLQA
ncbi:hypothetical protein GCM10020000_36320 [Streptomyces olivoverticillatus]